MYLWSSDPDIYSEKDPESLSDEERSVLYRYQFDRMDGHSTDFSTDYDYFDYNAQDDKSDSDDEVVFLEETRRNPLPLIKLARKAAWQGDTEVDLTTWNQGEREVVLGIENVPYIPEGKSCSRPQRVKVVKKTTE